MQRLTCFAAFVVVCLFVCLCLEDAECGLGAGVDGWVGGCCFVVIVTGYLFVCLNVCFFFFFFLFFFFFFFFFFFSFFFGVVCLFKKKISKLIFCLHPETS